MLHKFGWSRYKKTSFGNFHFWAAQGENLQMQVVYQPMHSLGQKLIPQLFNLDPRNPRTWVPPVPGYPFFGGRGVFV